MKLLRRFLAPLLAFLVALAPAQPQLSLPIAPATVLAVSAVTAAINFTPLSAGALTPAEKPVILGGIQSWSFPGSSADLYFARNGGSCTINRLLKPCASLLTTTRASTGYAQWADGHLSLFAANVPRITDLGLLVEQPATNIALWDRDLTNANWTKSSTAAALDQTGVDNGANSASSVTATGANGTVCAAAITSASASRTVSAFVERITGTGAVSISQDGGSTYTAITTKVGTTWYRPTPTDFAGLTQTVTNPQICFKLATSGDKIAVDFVDLEAGAFDTSPIATTTVAVTRAADSIVPAGVAASAFTPAAISIFVQSNNVASFSGFPRYIGYSNGHAPLQITNNTKTSAYNGSVELDATLGSGTVTGGTVKTAIGYDGTGRSIVANNGTVATDANVEALGANTVFIGAQSAGGQFLNGYITRLAVFGRRLPDAQLQGLTR